MTTKKVNINKLSIICFVLLTVTAIGQTSCPKEKIYGEWNYIRSSRYRDNINLDSLKNTIGNANEVLGLWSFRTNGTYDYHATQIKYRSKGNFRFSSDSCEIQLGKNKGKTLTILYLDDKYLITMGETPKAPLLYIHTRK